jgi:hypothetical protein
MGIDAELRWTQRQGTGYISKFADVTSVMSINKLETFVGDPKPLFRKGNPNPERLGFIPLRSSSGTEPDPERVQEAAGILGRQSCITDSDGYECELVAAAISVSGRVAYVESRAKDVGPHPLGEFGRLIDISIRIHLVEKDGTNRSVDIESYNPFFGCEVRFFEWFGDTAVLIYREKHWTFACRFGDIWPPRFVKIEDDWILHNNQLACLGYREESVRRLSVPELQELEPLAKEAAAELGLLLGS